MKREIDIDLTPLVPILSAAVKERHEQKRIVRCDICDAEEKGTFADLIERGWFIGNGMEICNKHE